MRSKLLMIIFFSSVIAIVYSCQNQGQIDQAQYASNGKDLYTANCQNCHGAQGEGMGELIPPLTDTLFLKANKKQLACYIKNGVSQEMTINGKIYDGKMPGFSHLEDIDIAQIITYITNSFGNNQGVYPYQSVAEDLKNCENQ
jgi:mono/diheme cytochrome c family protein